MIEKTNILTDITRKDGGQGENLVSPYLISFLYIYTKIKNVS
jgi:hypothetical protein